MSTSNDDDCEVGYRKPPKATRFRKGQSGNPKGRPKGKPNAAAAILRALGAKLVINDHGRRRKVTKYEAAIMQLANKAASPCESLSRKPSYGMQFPPSGLYIL